MYKSICQRHLVIKHARVHSFLDKPSSSNPRGTMLYTSDMILAVAFYCVSAGEADTNLTNRNKLESCLSVTHSYTKSRGRENYVADSESRTRMAFVQSHGCYM